MRIDVMSCALVVALAAAGCDRQPETLARGSDSAAVAAATASGVSAGAPRDASAMRPEIETMMRRSAESWNRGDLDAFVGDYEDSTGTTFVTPRGALHGRAEVRTVYERRFAPGGVRDSLSFQRTEVHALAPGLAYVISFYHLTRGDSTIATGPTSLVMRRDAAGRWRIVHDHSS